jgi:hypothetical protein
MNFLLLNGNGDYFLIDINSFLLLTSNLTFDFRKPDGLVITKTAFFVTNGSDGTIIYTTIENDLNVSGGWSLQAHVVTLTINFKTDIYNFTVEKNII